ncbi:5828_t:CDS:2, partial [Ambispora leptoticha]
MELNLINSCNGLIYVDNPTTKERYAAVAKEAREELRKKLLAYLISDCGIYLPVNLAELSESV